MFYYVVKDKNLEIKTDEKLSKKRRCRGIQKMYIKFGFKKYLVFPIGLHADQNFGIKTWRRPTQKIWINFPFFSIFFLLLLLLLPWSSSSLKYYLYYPLLFNFSISSFSSFNLFSFLLFVFELFICSKSSSLILNFSCWSSLILV